MKVSFSGYPGIYGNTYAGSYHSKEKGSFLSQLNDLRAAASSQKEDAPEGTNPYIHCPQLSASDAAKRDSVLAQLVEKGDLTQAQADLIKSGVTPVSLKGPALTRCGEKATWDDVSGVLDLHTYYQLLFERIPDELGDSSAAQGYKTFMDALDEMLGKE